MWFFKECVFGCFWYLDGNWMGNFWVINHGNKIITYETTWWWWKIRDTWGCSMAIQWEKWCPTSWQMTVWYRSWGSLLNYRWFTVIFMGFFVVGMIYFFRSWDGMGSWVFTARRMAINFIGMGIPQKHLEIGLNGDSMDILGWEIGSAHQETMVILHGDLMISWALGIVSNYVAFHWFLKWHPKHPAVELWHWRQEQIPHSKHDMLMLDASSACFIDSCAGLSGRCWGKSSQLKRRMPDSLTFWRSAEFSIAMGVTTSSRFSLGIRYRRVTWENSWNPLLNSDHTEEPMVDDAGSTKIYRDDRESTIIQCGNLQYSTVFEVMMG